MSSYSQRAPKPEERCTCGRTAVLVYVFDTHETPYCGIPDGGMSRKGSDTDAED